MKFWRGKDALLMSEIWDRYLEFLVGKLALVSDNRVVRYRYLIHFLFEKDFIWMPEFPLDSDREEDGYMLRNEFMNGVYDEADRARFTQFCQSKKASCLEVMIALCERICNEVFSDPEKSVVWLFWSMIDNLGLTWAVDENFNRDVVDNVINIWLYRRYAPDGSLGNIFHFRTQKNRNIQKFTIWEQANLYMRYVE